MGVDIVEKGHLDRLPLGEDIDRLPPHHPLGPGGKADLVKHCVEEPWIEVADVRGICEEHKGLSEKGVAC